MEEAPEFITVPAEPHFHKWVPYCFICAFVPPADLSTLSKMFFHATTGVDVLWPFVIACVKILKMPPYLSTQSELYSITHVTYMFKNPPLTVLKQFQAVEQ